MSWQPRQVAKLAQRNGNQATLSNRGLKIYPEAITKPYKTAFWRRTGLRRRAGGGLILLVVIACSLISIDFLQVPCFPACSLGAWAPRLLGKNAYYQIIQSQYETCMHAHNSIWPLQERACDCRFYESYQEVQWGRCRTRPYRFFRSNAFAFHAG